MPAGRSGWNHATVSALTRIDLEELFTQALVRSFAETAFDTKDRNAAELTKLFYELDPRALDKSDATLIHLLSRVGDAGLDEAARRLVDSHEKSGNFQPEILAAIAKRYENRGNLELALK